MSDHTTGLLWLFFGLILALVALIGGLVWVAATTSWGIWLTPAVVAAVGLIWLGWWLK